MQKIEPLPEANVGQQLGYGQLTLRRGLLQRPPEAPGSRQRLNRTTDALGDALEIAIRGRQIGTDLGDQQAVKIIASPQCQHCQQQRQHHAERQQRQQ